VTLPRGGTLGVVGESGSGKSMLALAIMGLLRPAIGVTGGAIRLDGVDLPTLPEPAMRRVRGARIALAFQEPMTALNPLQPIGWQVAERTIPFISRDIELVAGFADEVAVMYARRVVEHGPARATTRSRCIPIRARCPPACRGWSRSRPPRRHRGPAASAGGAVDRLRRLEEPVLRDLGEGDLAACHHPLDS